ncbi:MAG TPA: PHB depolymerase family esterase [Polyangiaceae bacterium]|nr:PHB depolymerase family esterase [Polyangiaceae bacterium]
MSENPSSAIRYVAIGIIPLCLWSCESSAPTGGVAASGATAVPTLGGSGGQTAAGGSASGAPSNSGSGGTTGGHVSTGAAGTGPLTSGGTMLAGASSISGSGGAPLITGGTSTQPSAGSGAGGRSAGGATGSSGVGASPTGGASTGGATAGVAGAGGAPDGPCPPSATVKAGDNKKTVTTKDGERTFLVHAPPSYDGKKRVPVVFDFHGLSGNGAQQKSLSRWDRLGDSQGFMTVYPDGLEQAWNAGLCCTDKYDDVAFVRAIIESLETDACIDTKRIYASGCSNGGGMSYKLACEASDVIAAVAPVDFDCVAGTKCSQCSPTRPVSVVQFRGTKDQLVAYEGDGAFSGAKNNFAKWGQLNMCTGSAAALTGHAGCESYPMCGSGSETVLCSVENGTHCGSYSSFMIPTVAWDVLQRHALP